MTVFWEVTSRNLLGEKCTDFSEIPPTSIITLTMEAERISKKNQYTFHPKRLRDVTSQNTAIFVFAAEPEISHKKVLITVVHWYSMSGMRENSSDNAARSCLIWRTYLLADIFVTTPHPHHRHSPLVIVTKMDEASNGYRRLKIQTKFPNFPERMRELKMYGF